MSDFKKMFEALRLDVDYPFRLSRHPCLARKFKVKKKRIFDLGFDRRNLAFKCE